MSGVCQFASQLMKSRNVLAQSRRRALDPQMFPWSVTVNAVFRLVVIASDWVAGAVVGREPIARHLTIKAVHVHAGFAVQAGGKRGLTPRLPAGFITKQCLLAEKLP